MGGPARIIQKAIKPKEVEQPKVEAQMDNTDVKSDLINADKISLDNKRKGRKSTVLTSVTGVDAYPTLNKKTLLG